MDKKETMAIYLTSDEAFAFKKFQEYHEVISFMIGYFDSSHLKLKEMRNTQVVLDIDNNGIISHMAITNHFRK